jgi:hypothetical protein
MLRQPPIPTPTIHIRPSSCPDGHSSVSTIHTSHTHPFLRQFYILWAQLHPTHPHVPTLVHLSSLSGTLLPAVLPHPSFPIPHPILPSICPSLLPSIHSSSRPNSKPQCRLPPIKLLSINLPIKPITCLIVTPTHKTPGYRLLSRPTQPRPSDLASGSM